MAWEREISIGLKLYSMRKVVEPGENVKSPTLLEVFRRRRMARLDRGRRRRASRT